MKRKIIYILLFLQYIIASVCHSQNIAGFISQGYAYTSDNYFYTDTTEGSFQFNALGVNVNSRISEQIKAGIQLISYTTGELGKNDVSVDWGYADIYFNRYLNFKAGLLKFPMGLYNENRDIDSTYLFVYLPCAVYSIKDRDAALRYTGIAFHGDFALFSLGDLAYQIGAGRPDIKMSSGTIKRFEDSSPGDRQVKKFTVETNYYLDLKWYTPVTGLDLKWTFRTSRMDLQMYSSSINETFGADISKTNILTASAKYEWKNISFDYELYDQLVNVKLFFFNHDEDIHSRGWYMAVKYTFTDAIQAGCYYSEFYDDYDNRRGNGGVMTVQNYMAWQEEFCIAVRFDITDAWIFKIEQHFINGTSSLFLSDHIDQNGVPQLKKGWNLFTAKLSFLF